MNDKFDELAKGLAQSVTRRQALKKFGVGFAGVVLALLGLANSTQAQGGGQTCNQWSCADIYGDWYVYICGGRKPKCRGGRYPCTCELLGPVDCSYCNYKCC